MYISLALPSPLILMSDALMDIAYYFLPALFDNFIKRFILSTLTLRIEKSAAPSCAISFVTPPGAAVPCHSPSGLRVEAVTKEQHQ